MASLTLLFLSSQFATKCLLFDMSIHIQSHLFYELNDHNVMLSPQQHKPICVLCICENSFLLPPNLVLVVTIMNSVGNPFLLYLLCGTSTGMQLTL